jgi:hypothetical protein
MASAPTLSLDIRDNGSFALRQSDCIMARVLAANTAETIQAPTNAKYVVFSADGDFYCTIAASSTAAAVPAADVTDGSASELNPAVRIIPYDTSGNPGYISVIAPMARVVTMMFYKV